MKFGSEAKGSDPKPKGALAALVASTPRSPDEPVEEESSSDLSFRALAKAFGIPPERQAAAQAALHQYILDCKGSEEDEEY